MELSKAIISGSATAASMVHQLLSLPRLISTSPAWTIALETESLQQHGEAQVAESVLISSLPHEASKKYIADNVAPGPYIWRMDGYIPGNQLAEPTNLYTPIVRNNVARLRRAFKSGAILSFKDGDNIVYPSVVIQSLDIDTRATDRNKQPFSMVIKEINVLDSIAGEIVENASIIAAGSAGGEARSVGSTASKPSPAYSIIAPASAYGVAAVASIPQN